MTTTAAIPARHELLISQLEDIQRLGVVAGFDRTNPTGNKVQWTIELVDGGFETVETRELEAFLQGARLALAASSRPGAKRPPKLTSTRKAILEDGRVVVDLRNPGDAAELKRRRNGLFSDAYALGLKGRFHVSKEGDKLVGETDEYRDAHNAAELKESA